MYNIEYSIGVWRRITKVGGKREEETLERKTKDETQNGVAA